MEPKRDIILKKEGGQATIRSLRLLLMCSLLQICGCTVATPHRPIISFLFLEDTLLKLKNKTIGLLRLDSGFFQSDILDYVEEKAMNYVVAVKFTHPVKG